MDLFRSAWFASHVEDLMKQHRVPGLAMAVVQNDQIESAGYGRASLERETPCTSHTLFDIASSAKSLTATAVALLVADDAYPEVQYDALMSDLLPGDFVMPGDEHHGVTVDDILSHRTGMAGHDNSYLGVHSTTPDNPQSITRNLRNLAVAAPIRSRYLYCNMMYTVATYLVEVKSGQCFADFLEKRLFEPLEMTSTTLQPSRAYSRGLGECMTTGYVWQKQSATYKPLQIQECPEGQGAGSIVTSVNDFARFIKALMIREGPISEAVYQGLVRSRTIVNPHSQKLRPHTSPTFYASGLDVYYYRGHTVIGHNGAVSGFASRFFFLPDLQFGAVVAGNSEGAASVASMLCRELIDEVLGVPQHERREPRSASASQKSKQGGKQQKSWEITTIPSRGSQAKRDAKFRDQTPQETPLEAYTGEYHHPGYHALTVQVRDDRLFIDATDRSMGFSLIFVHLHDQTQYTAYLSGALEGGNDPVAAEFVFDNHKISKMGLHLEPALKDKIWFDRVRDSGT